MKTILTQLPLLPLAICLLIAVGCAPAPLYPATLPPPLAARLTPAKPLTKSKLDLCPASGKSRLCNCAWPCLIPARA